MASENQTNSGPPTSLSTEEELSAWRRYQSQRVGEFDLLALVDDGKIAIPENIDTSSDAFLEKKLFKTEEIVENLKQRWKAGLSFTSIGHQALVAVNLNNQSDKRRIRMKELKKRAKEGPKANESENIDDDEDFLFMLTEEKQMLVHDARAHHVVQEHNQAHIFALATRCYWHMLRDNENQIIAITGESGSGKTEMNKFIVKQLTELSESYARQFNRYFMNGQPQPLDKSAVPRRLKAAFVALESFGSACTQFNPNSSRLHKYTELQFNQHGKLVGAKIVDFLLERRRATKSFDFARGERNFHVFYDMFAPGVFTKEEKERFYLLDSWKQYKYLQPGSGTAFGLETTEAEMVRVPVSLKRALRGCGFSAKKQDELFKIISAIMLFGNLEFARHEAKKDEGAYVKNTDVLEKIAQLLGVNPEGLATTLTQRTSTEGGTICADFLTVVEAKQARDDFATTLYTLIFDYIVQKINEKLDSNKSSDESSKKWEYWIGLFDIGGIENYGLLTGETLGQGNKFWQFATNFADERLQLWLRKQVFSLDNSNAESVMWKLESEMMKTLDSRISTYSNPGSGVLSILDQETIQTPLLKIMNSSCEELVDVMERSNQVRTNKRQTIFGRMWNGNSETVNSHFVVGSSGKSFGIRHYGGTGYGAQAVTNQSGFKVFYDASDFLISNKLGGRGKGSQAFPADYVRLIKGTADYNVSRNVFLLDLIDKQLKVVTSKKDGQTTILSAVRRGEETGDVDLGLKRIPSARKNNDDLSLSTMVQTKNHILKQAIKNSAKQQATASDALTENPDLAPEKPAFGTPTTSSSFYADLNSLFDSLDQNGSSNRVWTVFCVKPNDELSSKKFVDERVKDQLRRFDLILLLLEKHGKYTTKMTWKSFWARYSILEDAEGATEKQAQVAMKRATGHRRQQTSLASIAVEGEDLNRLKQQCRQLYEMYAIITSCGNGIVDAKENELALNERAWWALERNLVQIESKIRLKNKSNFEKLGFTAKKSGPEDWEYISDASDTSVVSNIDADRSFQKEIDEQLQEKRQREKKQAAAKITSQRKWWLRITKILTWWIPTYLIMNLGGMKRPEIIQAWREKVALNVIVILISTIMLFLIVAFGELLCPTEKMITLTPEELKSYNNVDQGTAYISMYGKIYQMSSLSRTHEAMVTTKDPSNSNTAKLKFNQNMGYDISKYFRRSRPDVCNFGRTLAKRAPLFIPSNGEPSAEAREIQIGDTPSGPPTGPVPNPPPPLNNAPVSSGTGNGGYGVYSQEMDSVLPGVDASVHDYEKFVARVFLRQSDAALVGNLGHSISDISLNNGKQTVPLRWIIIDDKVYDVSATLVSDFPNEVQGAFTLAAGTYATGYAYQTLMNTPNIKECLDASFYIGIVDKRNTVACQAASYSLLALTIILCAVMGAKFLAALQLGARRQPEEQHRYCILQVPCYTEGVDSLKKTINSLSLLDYDDSKKLLFIIADGLIKGSGNEKMTPELVLDILGVDNAHEKLTVDTEVPRYDYVALGDGMNRLNRAKVFSGWYRIQGRRIPYIVVVKCGKESETRRPGNRGKRDSQLILMKFLNKIYHKRDMCPLELEMYRQINQVIGADPSWYEYCLMVDADTEVVGDSLNRLISVMLHDAKTMGLCGETQIGNEMDTFITMIQVYEYYISHHMAKAFESLFGSVTCLPGCFCMYRIRSPGVKSIPLLIADDVIRDYDENIVDTLHKKNLLSLGEDRYLTTLMLKYFPDYRNKFTADACCRTIVPDQWQVLFSQRRRWINSTIHNLFELLLINQLCGCLCFSMRLVVFLDLFATLCMPASLGYLVYLIFYAVQKNSASTIAQSLYLFAAIYGAQAIIFLLRRKWDMIGWMCIYIVSLPVFGFFLPLYSFWHFDDFSWGNTRVVTGEKNAGHGGAGDEEHFDEKSVKTMSWEQFRDLPAAKREPRKTETLKSEKSSEVKKTAKSDKRRQSERDVSDTYDAVSEYASTSLSRPLPYGYAPSNAPLFPAYFSQPYAVYAPPMYPTESRTPSSVGTAPTEKMIEGVPANLYPLPESIPSHLARTIIAEVAAIIQSEDLRYLTKKKVRERVEHNLVMELQGLQPENYRNSPQRLEDLLKCRSLNVEIDFTHDSTRKDWVSRAIVEMLKRMAPK